jgi:hypothetical protein
MLQLQLLMDQNLKMFLIVQPAGRNLWIGFCGYGRKAALKKKCK